MPFATSLESILFLVLIASSACQVAQDRTRVDLDLKRKQVFIFQEKIKKSECYALNLKEYKKLKNKLTLISNPLTRRVNEAVFDLTTSEVKLKSTLRKSGISLSIKASRFTSEMTLVIHRLNREPVNGSIFQNERYKCKFNDPNIALDILKGSKSIAQISDRECAMTGENTELFSRLDQEFTKIAKSNNIAKVVLYTSLEPVMMYESDLVSGLIDIAGEVENLELTKTKYGPNLVMIELRKLGNRGNRESSRKKIEQFLRMLAMPIRIVNYSRSEMSYILTESAGERRDALVRLGLIIEI